MSYRKIDVGSGTFSIAKGILSDSEIDEIMSRPPREMTLEDFKGNQGRYEFYLEAKQIFQKMEDQRQKNISDAGGDNK